MSFPPDRRAGRACQAAAWEPGAQHGEGDPGKDRGLLRQREQLPTELSFGFVEVETAH